MNGTLTILAAISAIAALFLAVTAHRRITGARRSLLMLQGTYEGKTLLDAVSSYLKHIASIEDRLEVFEQRQEELFGMLGRSARNLGVVRYDAFEDMGGKMSFSVALVDDHANGAVITSINARTESRSYVKQVVAGESDHTLSREERDAIAEALGHKAKRSARLRR